MADLLSYEAASFYVFALASSLYLAHMAIYMIAANLYDIGYLRARMRQGSETAEGPLVSVLIPAHNEELVIGRCLASVLESDYPRVQIVVVDDGSSDATSQLVQEYIARQPDADISLLHTPQNVGKGEALNYGIRHRAVGELVMTLDADSVLMRSSISNAVRHFADPAVVGVAANVRIIEGHTFLTLLQRLEHMISYRSKKFNTLVNCEFVIGGVASTYRLSDVREVGGYDTSTVTEDIGLSMKIVSTGNRDRRLVYASDVVAMTEGVTTAADLFRQRYRWKYGSLQNLIKYRHLICRLDRRFTPTLTHYRLPLAVISEFVLLCSPIVWAYVLYLTVTRQNAGLVVGAFLTITMYTMVTIWFDEQSGWLERIRLSLYVPIAYFMFYFMDIIQFFAAVRCLTHAREIASGEGASGPWVSPLRVGRV